MPRGFLFFVKMRIYSNIFIHIPGFTKSDLEFISNSTTHEEVTLLAATCGMFIEKIHFYDPSTIPLHNQYEMKLVDTDVFEIAMFLDEIKAYETVYIGSRRISGNGAHLIHVSIRYNLALIVASSTLTYNVYLFLTFQASVNLDNLLKSRGICISLFNDQVRE